MSYYMMVRPQGGIDWTTDRQCAGIHVISFGPFTLKERRAAEAKCRLMYDKTYAIPGMPEAFNMREALDALMKFTRWAKWPRMEIDALAPQLESQSNDQS